MVSYVRRHFASLNEEDRFVATFDSDLKIRVNLSNQIEAQIFWQGVQGGDRGEVKLLKSLLKPRDIFFDIGANIGVFSLLAAKRLVKGEVHAFEPSTEHLSKLKQNIRMNGFRNIIVNEFGLSSSLSKKKLYIPTNGNTGKASIYAERDSQEKFLEEDITVQKLDDYVSRSNLKKVDILKIDVEGAELDVLDGARMTLKEHSPRILMEADADHLSKANRTFEELIDFLHDFDYSIYWIDNDSNLSEIHNTFDYTWMYQNIYCCPRKITEKDGTS